MSTGTKVAYAAGAGAVVGLIVLAAQKRRKKGG
jgi:LPXTG-motif cell wall-anchored protein